MRRFYTFRFEPDVSFRNVEESLLLAVFASESLYGRAQVRLDASFALDAGKHSCVIDGTSDVGFAIARIFTGFLSLEFGEEAYRVERQAAVVRS